MTDSIRWAAVALLIASSQQAWSGAHDSDAVTGDPAAGAEKARGCLGCHRNDDFSGFSQAVITQSIEAIVAEQRSHPLRLELNGQDVADLSAYLDESSD